MTTQFRLPAVPRLLIALAFIGAGVSFAGEASARKYGSRLITRDTELAEDQFGNVRFGADDIKLDCKGKQVHISSYTPKNCYPFGNKKCGIDTQGHQNVTIQNCVLIGGFDVGISVHQSHGTKILFTDVYGALSAGVSLEESNNLVVDYLTTGQNNGSGVSVENINDSIISNAYSADNALAGYDEAIVVGTGRLRAGSFRLTHSANTAHGNGDYGFSSGLFQTFFVNTAARDNVGRGYVFYGLGDSDHVAEAIIATGNGGPGLSYPFGTACNEEVRFSSAHANSPVDLDCGGFGFGSFYNNDFGIIDPSCDL